MSIVIDWTFPEDDWLLALAVLALPPTDQRWVMATIHSPRRVEARRHAEAERQRIYRPPRHPAHAAASMLGWLVSSLAQGRTLGVRRHDWVYPLELRRQRVLRWLRGLRRALGIPEPARPRAGWLAVIELACEEVGRLGQSYLGGEHLLLGLLRQRSRLARAALGAHGVDLNRVRAVVMALPYNADAPFGGTLARGPLAVGSPLEGPFGATPQALGILERSFEEAIERGELAPGPEHLLVALLEARESVAVGILQGLGLDWRSLGGLFPNDSAGLATAIGRPTPPDQRTNPTPSDRDMYRQLARVSRADFVGPLRPPGSMQSTKLDALSRAPAHQDRALQCRPSTTTAMSISPSDQRRINCSQGEAMADYEPIELHAMFRAGHSTIWELADKAGVLAQLNMRLASLDFCESSTRAENGLLDGSVDVVAGNHISPYAKVAQGHPIICLASPGNRVRDSIISREPISSVADLRGKRIADTAIEDPIGGYHHIRGNHMLYVMQGGLALDDVEWVVVADYMGEEFQRAQLKAMTEGTADATFTAGSTEEYEKRGFHILLLDPLPMITGPTITTSLEALNRKDRLGERLVKAMILTIHFAKTRQGEAQQMLGAPTMAFPEGGRRGRAASMARLPMKPYPDPAAIMNAYELCCMQYPIAREVSPLALWDMHYLRELDYSGFIDELATETPS